MSDEEDFDINDPKAQKVEIGKFVSKYLHAQNLNVLPVKILQRAVEAYVDSKEITAISQ